MTLKETFRLISADLRERARIGSERVGLITFLKLPLNPPALVVVVYRFQHYLFTNGWKRLAELLRRINLVVFSADISSQAVIGEHFILFHTNGIVISDRAQIGNNVYLVHHNTIAVGPRMDEKPDDQVVIEDNVILGCGARIVGAITVGHDSFIGAGAVVTESLPECSFHYFGPGENPAI